jgi:hypothetical protein
MPPIEFGNYRGGSAVVPVITLSTGERSEKERIIRLDAYTLTVTFRYFCRTGMALWGNIC